ncbi:MAG: elongation factor Ts [Clostridia bacterium]|nr:elongation factor Ts [Clostridia bacterium]MBP3293746.1 elongation factor Ts [Clostridia bacterium]
MAAITAKMVNELRAKTGAGMMECKKALVETDGNFDEAIKVLREKGLGKADKKAGRIAAEGVVDIYTEGTTSAMIEVNAETDFVAKNDTFKAFVKGILKVLVDKKPATVEELKALPYDADFATVEAKLKDMIFTIGENMNIRRFVLVDGITSTYIHGGGMAGVIVKFDVDEAVAAKAEFAEFAKNICLQIAAGTPPTYVNREDVPASVLAEEKEILMAQIKNDEKNANKPEQIIAKMVEGRIGKFYERACLVDQLYVKDDSLTIGKYVAATAKELGGSIKIDSFVLYEKGEGLEKREDDFAEEIAKLTGKA